MVKFDIDDNPFATRQDHRVHKSKAVSMMDFPHTTKNNTSLKKIKEEKTSSSRISLNEKDS